MVALHRKCWGRDLKIRVVYNSNFKKKKKNPGKILFKLRDLTLHLISNK